MNLFEFYRSTDYSVTKYKGYIGSSILEGLEFLHSHGFIHCALEFWKSTFLERSTKESHTELVASFLLKDRSSKKLLEGNN